MQKYVFFVYCLVIPISALPASVTKQFRNDYVYNRKTDAFYKLHIESVRRWQAGSLCKIEGSDLMVPKQDADLIQLHSMLKEYPDIGEFVWVGEDEQHHEVAAAPPIIDLGQTDEADTTECEVVSRDGEVELLPCYRQLPFMCKVTARDVSYDEQCGGVTTKGYKFFQSTGSCYKIPESAFTWSHAYSECDAEGAHLAVINSKAEAEVLKNFTSHEPKVVGSRFPWFYFVGFRADAQVGNATRVFKTIFNQTIEEAGFAEWSENEPNNHLGSENCGSLFSSNGKLNDAECTHKYGFICEKEIQ